MSMLKSLYVSEVLGVKKYLCPKEALSVRHLKGKLPCDLLIVVGQEPSYEQNSLLQKIITSIRCTDYSVLIVKQLEVLSSLMDSVEKQNLAQKICLFGESLSHHDFKNIDCIKTYSLNELEGDNSEVYEKKKDLWGKLRKWKQPL